MKQVVIIGGGASGLMAGIMAAREGAAVTILEKCEKPGKKLLATGNGRCNLTNRRMEPSCYCGDQELIRRVLESWSFQDTLDFFHELGLWTKERDSWIYPRTDQASSVLQLLLQEFGRLKGKLKTLEEVREIRRENEGFLVVTNSWQYPADAVIASSGTPASNIEGVSDQALQTAASFGIASHPFRPALVPLRCIRENWFTRWAGVRCQAELRLICDGRIIQTERGELQLTDYGISGIPVFQLSSRAGELLEKGAKPVVEICFFPDTELSSLTEELERLSERFPDKNPAQLLTGLLPDKLIAAFCGKKSTVQQVLQQAESCILRIASTGPLKQAQICAGGILSEELTPELESKKVPGLFFTGECINIDGRCGGYNLQWAWSTGAIAGKKAGTSVFQNNGDKKIR